uniref:Kef-type K+ transport system membrane component n=1 Tax=uncultured euryarchaeote Alv-FOS5 TaxID=337891 RepID=Q3SBA2_9EURY|nr:Kef-type K+ transport system membrane component [uncultured euryarchaeote Alv-FOS5]
MITERLILDMGVILALAMLLGAILEKYKFPSVLGYILAGLIVGPLTGIIHSNEVLDLFSEVGVIMVLFYIGLELDPNKLKEGGLAAFILGPAKILLGFILGFLVGQAFGFTTLESSFLGFIIMMSSTAVIGKYLMDKDEMKTLHASIAITMLLIEDFIAILILAILGSMHTGGGITSVMLTSVAIVLVFLIVISEYSHYLLNFIERFEYKKHIALYSLGIVFFLSYLVSFFGLAPSIGAFFAGYLLSGVGHHKEIEEQLGTFREFFSAFFFVSVGMMFTIPTTMSAYMIVGLLLVLSVVARYLVYGGFGTYLGMKPQMAAKLSGLMIPIGEFSLIIANYAFVLKLAHAHTILDSAILLGLSTAFLMPYGISYTDKFSKILERIPKSHRLSLAGSLIHVSRTNKKMKETIVTFFRSLGVYLLAGFSVIYLLMVADTKLHFTLLGYSAVTVSKWIAVALLLPILYGIVEKIRWLGIRLVGIAGPSLFPDLKDYHITWMQHYLADLLAGFALIMIAVFTGLLSWTTAPNYVVFPILIFILGAYYTTKGYLRSIENYEKIKRGIRTKQKMKWVGGRLR